jgi:hypothetical protein
MHNNVKQQQLHNEAIVLYYKRIKNDADITLALLKRQHQKDSLKSCKQITKSQEARTKKGKQHLAHVKNEKEAKPVDTNMAFPSKMKKEGLANIDIQENSKQNCISNLKEKKNQATQAKGITQHIQSSTGKPDLKLKKKDEPKVTIKSSPYQKVDRQRKPGRETSIKKKVVGDAANSIPCADTESAELDSAIATYEALVKLDKKIQHLK